MNESSNPKTMYEAVPAVAELNKVPGFDPLKFLRRTKDSMRLDLPYQKLWFRMAHPNGRMRVTALRITEQMAVFEARVFLDRGDAEPFSMSVAQQQLQDKQKLRHQNGLNGTAAFSLFRGFLFKVFIRRGSRFKLFIPQKTIGRKGCVQVVISNCGTAPRLEIESVVGTNPKPGSFAQKQSGFCALGIY